MRGSRLVAVAEDEKLRAAEETRGLQQAMEQMASEPLFWKMRHPRPLRHPLHHRTAAGFVHY